MIARLLKYTLVLLAIRTAVRALSAARYNFRGKVVLITGGSRGLGLVMARQLGRMGARLSLLARDPAELDRAAAELKERGYPVMTLVGDVREAKTAEEAINSTVHAYGRLDVLINNAGIITVGPLENMGSEDFENSFATHLWGPLRFMTSALPHLKRSGGRIVNISSVGGKIAVPHLAPYSASKFALGGLSEAFRAELTRDGVTITTVFPGLMRTGSHVHAQFKGQHGSEFAWFAIGQATPLTSESAERAARQILQACREGRAELVVGVQAKLAVVANSLFPNLAARLSALANILLPRAGAPGPALSGSKARGAFPSPKLTILPDRASRMNNELG